jgi:hypothetical protein
VPKKQTSSIAWLDDANPADYEAAAHYLALVDTQKTSTRP